MQFSKLLIFIFKKLKFKNILKKTVNCKYTIYTNPLLLIKECVQSYFIQSVVPDSIYTAFTIIISYKVHPVLLYISPITHNIVALLIYFLPKIVALITTVIIFIIPTPNKRPINPPTSANKLNHV